MLSCLQLLPGCLQNGFCCPTSPALDTVTSMPQALLEAEGKGDTWKVLGLPAAPHLIGVDGEVRVPDRWENLIRGSEGYKEYVQRQKAAKAAARAAKSPNRTPPRSPISC